MVAHIQSKGFTLREHNIKVLEYCEIYTMLLWESKSIIYLTLLKNKQKSNPKS